MNKDFWRDRPVLITGCSGFLGTWLSLRLVDAGARVVGLVRDDVPGTNFARSRLKVKMAIARGSVTDVATVERVLNEYSIDTCFHLAAQAIVGIANRSPVSTFESNIAGTWTLLDAVLRSSTVRRVVVASSDKAYGVYPEESLPYLEHYPSKAIYPYDVSKACADMIARCYFQTYFNKRKNANVALGVMRCGNIFGGGDLNFGRIVPDTVWAAIHDERPVIRSHGRHIRDFIYVLDAAEGYLTLAEQLTRDGVNGEAFNFALESPVSVIELVEKILWVTKKTQLKPEVRLDMPAPDEILAQHLSAQKARERLGWKAVCSLEDGLRDTIDWYEHWKNVCAKPAESLDEYNINLIRRFDDMATS